MVAVSLGGKLPLLASAYGRTGSSNLARQWISGALAIPAGGSNKNPSLFIVHRVLFFNQTVVFFNH